jgi:hypothetical protein
VVKEWDLLGTTLGLAGGAGTMLTGALKGLAKIDGLPSFAGNLSRLKTFDHWVGRAGVGLELLQIGEGFVSGDADKMKAGAVDLGVHYAFKGLAAAAVGFPPALIVVGAAEVAWEVFVPEELKVQIFDGVVDAGRGAIEAVGDFGNAVGDVGEAVGGFVSGGFNGAKKLFGW